MHACMYACECRCTYGCMYGQCRYICIYTYACACMYVCVCVIQGIGPVYALHAVAVAHTRNRLNRHSVRCTHEGLYSVFGSEDADRAGLRACGGWCCHCSSLPAGVWLLYLLPKLFLSLISAPLQNDRICITWYFACISPRLGDSPTASCKSLIFCSMLSSLRAAGHACSADSTASPHSTTPYKSICSCLLRLSNFGKAAEI